MESEDQILLTHQRSVLKLINEIYQFLNNTTQETNDSFYTLQESLTEILFKNDKIITNDDNFNHIIDATRRSIKRCINLINIKHFYCK
ncbi:ac73 [Oxyplax ochracea nucleopolyhedrovirus]|uniref:Ac73 n=1 Tax=Oxyplax ochracea nucleopolyhedrovirus TaxID=2083176 RepID=A0A2L0WU44_9ABAC|nr:ac73 [Oxyplax ochracea nucleopolyhedrovirus]AVA31164.1 ac73 [Oxyplax ochracea nucleopolyhedrovirus]